MPYEVEAFGSIIEVPDDVTHEEAYKQIMANEHKINPNYKKPLRDELNSWAQKNLAVDIGNKYGREDQKPLDKSDPNYDEFTDPVNFKSNSPEGFSGLAGNVLTGAKQTGRMGEAAINTVLGDRNRVEAIAKESNASAEANTPVEQKSLLGDLKQIDRNQSAFGQIGDTLKAAANNPMGTGQMVAEQLPNSAVSLAGGFTGFKAGAAAGSVFGPVGATIGGTLGFVGGMFLGNVLLEAGGKAIEKASDEDGFTPQDRDAALREGAIKAGVITGVDAATFKLGGMIASKLGGEVINAGARAEAKVLIDAGIDVTSLAAINTALKASPELFKTAKVAGERAAIQALSTGKKAAILGTGVAAETVGEFAGEAGGEYAATGKADYVDATIEALSSSTMSIAETAYNYNKVASGNDLSPEGIQKAASSINDIQTKAGIDNIKKAKTVDEAIQAANETVSTKPVDKEDILKSADPTLADIERLTGLKPSEAIAEQERILQESSIPQPDTRTTVGTLGHETEIVLPDNTSVKAQWRVVDADEIKAAMNEGVSQPRDRTRAASDMQIKGIANAPDYRRLSDSPVMDVGAPVIDQQGNIVAGNGRFEGISQSHLIGKSDAYKEALIEDAVKKGINASEILNINHPVLVRQLTEPVDTRKMAIASNSGGSLQYSALEQAKIDSDRMKGIENLDVTDSGDIALTPKNLTQLKDSLGNYTPTEMGSLVDKNGQLSQEGVKRVRNAMLAKAYGNSPVLERLVESTDSDIRNVLGALTKSAGHIINTKGDTKALLDAVSTYAQLKTTGQPVDNFLAQKDAFNEGLSKEAEGILKFIEANARSQKKLTDFFKGNFREVDMTSADMFEKNTPTKLYRGVKKGQENAPTVGDGLFYSPDRKVAEMYAGKDGDIKEISKEFKNLLIAKNWVEAKEKIGLGKSDPMHELVNVARNKGYDGITFKTLNGDEYIDLKPKELKDARIERLEKHLKDNGYDFHVEPVTMHDINALDSTKKARKELAENQAKFFKKKIVFIKADGKFKINGAMVPSIKDTIFVDIRSEKQFDAITAHELSHWMEQEKPDVYKSMVDSIKDVIINDAESGYAKKYDIEGSTKDDITKEIVADIMGDNFTKESFWDKVAAINPEAFKEIAAAIIKWLKNTILKAKSNSMGSEQWVKDAAKAQDIVAKAVAQYTVNENKPTEIKDNKPRLAKKEQLPETPKTVFDRYFDLGSDKGSITQSLSDAKKITGLDFKIPIKSAELSDMVPAKLDVNDGIIYYNKNWNFSKAEGSQYIAEELFHALDVVSDGKTISASSERLNTVDGDIYLESKKNFDGSGKYMQYLAYPLSKDLYPLLSAHTRQAELFARLGVLYSGDLLKMRDQLPLAYEAYHGIFKATRIGDSETVHRKVWSLANPYREMGSEHRATLPNAKGDEGFSGIRGASELEQIHKSIAKEFNANPDGKKVLFSTTEPQQPKPFNPNEDIPETNFRKAQRKVQDKFNRFNVVKEFLEKEKGIKLSENADVYKAEERYYGKVANQQEDFRNKVQSPLIKKIEKAGFKLDQVEEYLLNKHAQEANAQNRKLTGKDDSTAYGISDKEAQDYLSKAPKELGKLADEIQAITKATQKLRLDNGIETKERVAAMNGAYEYYVPVRGDAESQEKQMSGNGVGKGFSLKYKGKRRLGHEARNEAVIENIFQDYERAIIQVEHNRVGKSLLLMAAEIGMPELISINQPVKRKVLQTQKAYGVLVKGDLVDVFQSQEAAKQHRQLIAATDKKLTLSDITIAPITDQRLIYSASPMLADNEVLVYMDGHEIRMQINDDLLARSYKNMGVEALGHILSAGRAINGWMSKVYTGYNPEFIFTNLQRDFTAGIINLTGEQGITIAARAVANYPKSFATLLKYAATGESTKWIDAYRDNGGNTGAAYLPDLERVAQDVKREYAAYQGVIANLKEGDPANALRAAGRKAFNATLKYIEHLNQAGENAFRLATFKAMVDSGKSVKEAASMAKNVTVNFNRKGEIGAEMNAAFLFFNASVQGTAAVSHSLFKGRHKYQAWGLVGGMMTLGYMMASALGGFDDEDKYDEISDSTKSRNLIMSYGDGYLKIPVPYGHGFFYNAGRMYAEAQRKGELDKMPYQLMALATEEFSPFNVASTEDGEFNSKKVLYGFIPSAPAIPFEIATNYSRFTGRELYPEKEWYKSEPDNEKMWRGTKGTVYDVSAQYIASIGVEISPETLKHLVRATTGGSGAFVDTIVSSAMLKKEGAELDTREIPFVRKMYGEATIQDIRARFGKAKDEVRTAKEKFDAARRSNDISRVEKVLDDKKELLELNNFANKTSEVIKIFRDEQDAIKLSDKYTTAEKRLKIKELEKQEEGFYRMFLNDYKKIDRSKLK